MVRRATSEHTDPHVRLETGKSIGSIAQGQGVEFLWVPYGE